MARQAVRQPEPDMVQRTVVTVTPTTYASHTVWEAKPKKKVRTRR